MSREKIRVLLSVFLLLTARVAAASDTPPVRPNILFILTDDLGFGDVGVFFQNARLAAKDRALPSHLTPRLDAMAAEGMQLRGHYCPAPVCAPSRASLLLGVHQGHANVRDNQFDKALENNHTLATVLKQSGYATACIGKWGLQGKADPAVPNGFPAHPLNRGFDSYFGYISHNAGHWHYPKEDGQKLFDGAKDVAADYDKCYTTDLFTARAKKWIGEQHAAHADQPFFMYLAYDTPHAKLQLPPGAYPAGSGKAGGMQWLGTPGRMINSAGGTPDSYCHPDYASATWDDDHNPATPEKPWPDVYRRFATDVRRIDDCVGDLLAYLKDLGIDENTLVVFTSDNGPSQESYLPEKYEPTFFGSYGPHEGIKRDLWEGGIRVGAIARWPGKIRAAGVSESPSAFWDWMPTFTELAGQATPARSDGVSLLPTLFGTGKQAASRIYIEYFMAGKTPAYSEFSATHRGRVRQQMQGIRLGDFMGVRYAIKSQADPFEIYDVVHDPREQKNLATDPVFADLQRQMKETVLQVRRPDDEARRPYDAELVPATQVMKLQPGIAWKSFAIGSPWVAKLDDLPANKAGTSATIELPIKAGEPAMSVLFTGYIDAPVDGVYGFQLSADTGALLRVHEATVIDADAGYVAGTPIERLIRLQAGKHPIRLYYRHDSKAVPDLKLRWRTPDQPLVDIPSTALWRME